ncbi:MAG: class I SAM-dependent methyltransferase [Bryobacteraceae bacterium]
MGKRSLTPEAVEQYVSFELLRETDVQQRLRAETSKLAPNHAAMQIGPDQGAFFALLFRATGVRRALEIGTFTGYSALAVASALPPGGTLIACDISDEWTSIGRRYWQEAGVADRIDLRLGPAQHTLQSLIDAGEAGTFDFAFIDADKTGYDAYYEACLTLLRPNGLIALDNVLWSGAVVDPADQSEDTLALRAINRKIRDDSRVEAVLLTVGDGIMLARKK